MGTKEKHKERKRKKVRTVQETIEKSVVSIDTQLVMREMSWRLIVPDGYRFVTFAPRWKTSPRELKRLRSIRIITGEITSTRRRGGMQNDFYWLSKRRIIRKTWLNFQSMEIEWKLNQTNIRRLSHVDVTTITQTRYFTTIIS